MSRNRLMLERTVLTLLVVLYTAESTAELAYNLPEPVSPLTREIFDLHMLTAAIAFWISLVVTVIVIYAIYKFRRSQGYQADQHFHTSSFGIWSWILVPVIVLGIDLTIAGPGSRTLAKVEDYSKKADLTVKVTGSQWKWTYDYVEDDIRIVSNLTPLTPKDEHYLRDVDEPLVLPVNKQIRLLHTSTDVLHAWWVPSLAYKKDSIPGYINETSTYIEKEGVYRGQCAENCGTGHAYMPIVVNAVSEDAFVQWVAMKKEIAQQAQAEASADKQWTLAELMARGEALYLKNCVACHQANGAGLPGVFPALKGSELILNSLDQHIDIVLKGKAGTAMAPWGQQLNDLEAAAIMTYERNAWGNDTGEVVQPSAIKARR